MSCADKKVNKFKLQVSDIIKEASESVSIRFRIPAFNKEDFEYIAGQFIGLEIEINGELVTRSYSLSSCPSVNNYFQISVKKISGGKMSSYLVDQLKVGDVVDVLVPQGEFVAQTSKPKNHVFFAAGSGVTPIYAMIQEILFQDPKSFVHLMYWCRTSEDCMFFKEFKKMENTFENFKIFWGMTGAQGVVGVEFYSRINTEILQTCYLRWQTPLDPIFYVCGPWGFMESVESFLGQKGHSREQILKEAFTPKINPEDSDYRRVGDLDLAKAKCLKIDAEIDGIDVTVAPQKGETILEALIRAGEDPPYSCSEGTCMVCQCTVLKGAVDVADTGMLLDEDYEEGMILSCQAYPVSEKVKVLFE